MSTPGLNRTRLVVTVQHSNFCNHKTNKKSLMLLSPSHSFLSKEQLSMQESDNSSHSLIYNQPSAYLCLIAWNIYSSSTFILLNYCYRHSQFNLFWCTMMNINNKNLVKLAGFINNKQIHRNEIKKYVLVFIVITVCLWLYPLTSPLYRIQLEYYYSVQYISNYIEEQRSVSNRSVVSMLIPTLIHIIHFILRRIAQFFWSEVTSFNWYQYQWICYAFTVATISLILMSLLIQVEMQKFEKLLNNQKVQKNLSVGGVDEQNLFPGSGTATPVKKSPVKSWRPSPHLLASPGAGISSAPSCHTMQYDSINYDIDAALDTLKPVQDTSNALTVLGSPVRERDQMSFSNGAIYKQLQDTQNNYLHGEPRENELALIPSGGAHVIPGRISNNNSSSIRYQAGLVTDSDAQEAAYFQLPACSAVVASSAANTMKSHTSSLSRRKVTPSGPSTSRRTIQPTPHPTSIHGYINRPLHITTALFGYLSFNTLKNDFAMDSTTISQQLLGTAPPITSINTSMLLDSIVTATHIDNCKRFLGNYLHECIRRFDRVILHIVNKVNHLLLKNTNSSCALTNQQRQHLQNVLQLSVYEVPNSLSTRRTAAASTGTTTGGFGTTGSTGFGGFKAPATTGTTFFGGSSTGSSVFNMTPGVASMANPANSNVTDIYRVLTDTNTPTQMYNIQDVLYKMLYPIFSNDQSTVDAVAQSNSRFHAHSSMSVSGVDLIEEYDALATLFLSLFNKQQGVSIFIQSVKSMSAEDMSRLKYILTTPCDIYYTNASTTVSSVATSTSTDVNALVDEPSRNSIGYCILYHTKELVIHDASLSKIVWPVAPPKMNEQLANKQHISVQLPSDVDILMCIFLYYCNNSFGAVDSNRRTKHVKLSSNASYSSDNGRFSDVRYFNDLQCATDAYQKQNNLNMSSVRGLVSILEVPCSNFTDITNNLSHYSDYTHDMISTGVGSNHMTSSSFFGIHHSHSNATYHYIDNSALLIDSPHFNILMYDEAIHECVEIVLDSNHHQNSVCCIVYFIILYYKFEVFKPCGKSNSNRAHRELPSALKDLICKVFMIDQISEFESLLKQVNILQ